MDFKTLIIGNVAVAENKLALSLFFPDFETKEAAKTKSFDFFIQEYKNQNIIIIGESYNIEAKVLDVKITSSIIEYKTIHFLINLKEVGEIKTNDFVKIKE